MKATNETGAPVTGTNELFRVITYIDGADLLASFDSTPIASPGDLVVVRGGKCTGKSNFASLLAAACISSEPIGGRVCIPNGKKVIIFVTGEAQHGISMRMRRTMNTAGANGCKTESGQFVCMSLWSFTADQQRECIKYVCEQASPDIVCIDGVWSLMAVAYSEKKLGEFMQFLRDLTNDGQRAVIVTLSTYAPDQLEEDEVELHESINTALLPAAQTIVTLTKEKKDDGGDIFHADICNRDYKEAQISYRIVGEEYMDKYVIL